MTNSHDTDDTDIDFSAAIDRLDVLNAQIRQHETRVRKLALYSKMTPATAAITGASIAATFGAYNGTKGSDAEALVGPTFGSMTLFFAFTAAVFFVKQQKTKAAVQNGDAQYQANMVEKAALLDVPVDTFKPLTPQR